jgi:hypothetical protein
VQHVDLHDVERRVVNELVGEPRGRHLSTREPPRMGCIHVPDPRNKVDGVWHE